MSVSIGEESPEHSWDGDDRGSHEAPKPDLQEIGHAVEHFLRTNGPQLGSVIGNYLRSSFSFAPREHGFASLHDFLTEYSPAISRIGTSGADLKWTFRGTDTDEASTKVGEAVWRALASPNSVRRIFVYVDRNTGLWSVEDRKTGELMRQLWRGTVEPQEWTRIEPAPAEAHRRLGEEFARREDLGSLGSFLGAALHQSERWWLAWRELLRDRPDLLQAWFDGRTRLIHAYIRSELEKAGLKGEAFGYALSVPRPGESLDLHAPVTGAGPSLTARSADVRALVEAVVSRMDLDELRRLHLPVGLVADVLHGGNR